MNATGKTALIVEDEMIIAMDLQIQLEDAGWQVLGPVGTIDQAQGVLGDATPDCALLDVNLGKETSFSLAERLSQQGTRVVFLTGKTRSVLPEELRHLEMIQKPLKRNELVRLLNEPSGSAA